LKKIFSIGVSLACLYFAFQQVNLLEVFTALSNTNLSFIISALIVTAITFFLRALRWKTLLKNPRYLTLQHYSSSTHIGYFLNNILPFRAGDIFRAKLLSNHDKDIKLSYLIGSLVAEKIIDLWVIGLFTIILILLGYTNLFGFQFILTVIAISFVSSLIIFGRQSLSNKLLISFPSLTNFVAGYKLVSENRIRLLSWSMLLWISFVAYVIFSLKAIGVNLTLEQSLGLTIISSIVTSLPIAPAAIGTYHLAVIYCLHNLYGFNLELAQTGAIVMHSIFLLYSIVVGYIYLLSENLNIGLIVNDDKN
tara:strand:- start:1879 stop:2799 length:921 start_codon:yes stop_codon:yes gene_type:complete